MRKFVVWIMVLTFFFGYVCPLEAIAGAKARKYAVAQYAGKDVQYVAVFSPDGGATLNEMLNFKVKKGQNIQIIAQISNLAKDQNIEAENVYLTVVGSNGKEIGIEGSSKEAKNKHKIKEYPRSKRIKDFDAKAQAQIKKIKKTKKSHPFPQLKQFGTKKEWEATAEEYEGKLKASKNTGMLVFPKKRFEGKGLFCMNLVNPSARGSWKIKIKAKNSSPFLATVLVIPLEMNEAQIKELRKAIDKAGSQIQTELPNYQGWPWSRSCDKCCKCKDILYAAGAVALIAAFLTAGQSLYGSLHAMAYAIKSAIWEWWSYTCRYYCVATCINQLCNVLNTITAAWHFYDWVNPKKHIQAICHVGKLC